VDPRIEAYAKLLVERSLDVQPGWQVWINSSSLGRPLVEEVVRLIARRGAYPLVRLGGAGMEDVPFETIWALEAPEDMLAEVAPADLLSAAWVGEGSGLDSLAQPLRDQQLRFHLRKRTSRDPDVSTEFARRGPRMAFSQRRRNGHGRAPKLSHQPESFRVGQAGRQRIDTFNQIHCFLPSQ